MRNIFQITCFRSKKKKNKASTFHFPLVFFFFRNTHSSTGCNSVAITNYRYIPLSRQLSSTSQQDTFSPPRKQATAPKHSDTFSVADNEPITISFRICTPIAIGVRGSPGRNFNQPSTSEDAREDGRVTRGGL